MHVRLWSVICGSLYSGFNVLTTSGAFYSHGLTLIEAWISYYIHYKVWDGITYPFPNFKGATVEVWEWISNFITHFTVHVIPYPWWEESLCMVVKGPLVAGRKSDRDTTG